MNEAALKARLKFIAQEKLKTFNDVWKQLLLERFLARLSHSPYRKQFIKCAVKPLPSGGGYKALVQNNMLLYTSFIQMDKPWGSRG